MPARISLSEEQITAALQATGGHIAAAASRLGICTRTLRRRLSQDPELLWAAHVHPVWARALEGNEAIRAGTDPNMVGDNPLARYENLLDWDELGIESEPRVLSEEETQILIDTATSEEQGPARIVNPLLGRRRKKNRTYRTPRREP